MQRLSGAALPAWLQIPSFLAARAPASFAALTLACAYFLVWYLRQGYAGLVDDAQLYAFQAMSHLNPHLKSDVFLKFGSQDDYTVFSPLYAWTIKQFGLSTATITLFLASKVWLAAAAWYIARRFTSPSIAWLCLGVMLVLPHQYGALRVFQVSEEFLSARLPAEALALTSLALALWNRPVLASLFAVACFAVHPLMAMPATLVMVNLLVKDVWRARLLVAAAAVTVSALVISFIVPISPLSPMESDWLEVISARSQFMFMQSWLVSDWDWTLLGLITLAFAACAHDDECTKRFFWSTCMVGVGGLILTAIVSFIIPVELIIQGQPWRWMWVVVFAATLSIASVIERCWATRDSSNIAAAALLIGAWLLPSAWAIPSFVSTLLAIIATLLFLLRTRIPKHLLKYGYALAALVTLLMIVFIISSMYTLSTLELGDTSRPAFLQRLRDWFNLSLPAAAAIALVWWAASCSRAWIPVTACFVGTIATLWVAMPTAWAEWTRSPYEYERANFAEWRRAIGPGANVLWLNEPMAVWFLLDSASYASNAQTAGLVFSREAAMEAKRRAAALRPLSGHERLTIATNLKYTLIRPLTPESLQSLCAAEELDHVVTENEIAAPHLSLPRNSKWHGVKLYSCKGVGAQP